MLALLVLFMFGCSTKENNEEGNFVSTEDANLLFQETVSPNKEYVESDDEIVYYTVEIYQNGDNSIVAYKRFWRQPRWLCYSCRSRFFWI
jgi:hypothetical protein